MEQSTEILPDSIVENVRQFSNLQHGKFAGKGWAASVLLRWITDIGLDEPETALASITGAAFAP